MRVLIVDDEAPARKRLKRLLADERDVEIAGEAANGPDAVAAIRRLKPDLVFLDVQMPGLDGFGVIDEVGVDAVSHVVFVTAYDEHALRAFEAHALDYLLKPVAPDRFAAVVERVRASLSRGPRGELPDQLARLVDAMAPKPRFLRRILVHQENKAFLLPVERIDRIEAERNYLKLHAGPSSYLVRSTVGALADRLDPGKFLQINRSEIVRLDAIREMQPWFHGDYRVVMTDGTTLVWSRRYRAKREAEFR